MRHNILGPPGHATISYRPRTLFIILAAILALRVTWLLPNPDNFTVNASAATTLTYHATGTVYDDLNHSWTHNAGEPSFHADVIVVQTGANGSAIIASGWSGYHGAFSVPFRYAFGHSYHVEVIPADHLQFPWGCGAVTRGVLPCGLVGAW